MNIGITTYAYDGLASFLGLGSPLPEKLKTIKAQGYDSVELLSIDLNNSTEDIKRWLSDTGLIVTSVHAEPTEEIVQKMAAIGGRAVIWPSTPFCSRTEAIEVAQQLDEMAEMAQPYGIQIGYHNHNWEFFVDEGKSLLEHVLDNSSKCFSQLDCGWAMAAGMSPVQFIRNYPNRILSVHVKENNKVIGTGKAPASRHGKKDRITSLFKGVNRMPAAVRRMILRQIEKAMKSQDIGMNTQCPMGAPDSNIDWKEIRKALDGQSFEAFWIVEREGFYDERDICLVDDCQWLRSNI